MVKYHAGRLKFVLALSMQNKNKRLRQNFDFRHRRQKFLNQNFRKIVIKAEVIFKTNSF